MIQDHVILKNGVCEKGKPEKDFQDKKKSGRQCTPRFFNVKNYSLTKRDNANSSPFELYPVNMYVP